MNTLHFTAFATSFLLAYLLIPYLSKFAQHYQLVDKPNSRKVHVYPVPLIGGISIFFAVGLTLVLSIPFGFKLWDHKNIIAALSILVLIGTIDDKYDIRASLKLAIQLLLAHFLFLQGLKIESLHGLFGVFEIHTDLQYLITILMVTGVVNAFNLMDGVDGLMAGISLIGFITFTCLAVL